MEDVIFRKHGATGRTELECDTFALVMVDAGVVVKSGHGSAVVFTSLERRVVFHKPHPSLVLHHYMLKRIQKRLARGFGWDKASFTLREL